MKRILVATILGIAASVANQSARGQANIIFDLYNSGPVTYAMSNVPPGEEGQPVDETFKAEAYVGFGTGFTSLSQLIPASLLTFSDTVPGHYSGTVILPIYTSGPVTLAVAAWETTGPYGELNYNLNPTTPVIQGASSLWVMSSLDRLMPTSISGPVFTVQIVPEPSALALTALSAATLMILRRHRLLA